MFYDKYSIANKKLETDFGVQVKKSEKQRSGLLKNSYFYEIFRMKREQFLSCLVN